MLVGEYIKKFKYSRGTSFDGFRYTTIGDCDDFALSVLIILEGGWKGAFKALLTNKARLWLVRSLQNKLLPRHIILRYKTPLGNKWIDSTVREWRDSPAPHKLRLPLLTTFVAFMALWGATFGKIFK